MSTDNQITLSAMDYASNGRPGLDTAARLADAVVDALVTDADASVVVSVRDLRGVSSSFYNLFFQIIHDRLGPDAVRNRVSFDSDSTVQRSIIQRSRSAVLGDDAA